MEYPLAISVHLLSAHPRELLLELLPLPLDLFSEQLSVSTDCVSKITLSITVMCKKYGS